jgi:hypothetical protein
MVSVDTQVVCPLCRSEECNEDFDCGTGEASYFCMGCGYASNTEVEERNLRKYVPKAFRRFVKWADFEEGSGAVVVGSLPWWPSGIVMAGQFSIVAVAVKGKLRWRRREIEEIPEAQRKNHPTPDGRGYYKFKDSETYADFDTFEQALQSSREEAVALNLIQNSSPKVKLLHGR